MVLLSENKTHYYRKLHEFLTIIVREYKTNHCRAHDIAAVRKHISNNKGWVHSSTHLADTHLWKVVPVGAYPNSKRVVPSLHYT